VRSSPEVPGFEGGTDQQPEQAVARRLERLAGRGRSTA
jgi:hypothetical protein